MPNTAAAVQEGVCPVSIEEEYKNNTLCSTVLSLFSLLGYSRLVTEYMLDSITASSGSGIAFVRTWSTSCKCVTIVPFQLRHSADVCCVGVNGGCCCVGWHPKRSGTGVGDTDNAGMNTQTQPDSLQ